MRNHTPSEKEITQTLHVPQYFDFTAASPVHPKVLHAMQPYFSEKFYNPSALYLKSRDVKQDLEAARSAVARIIGAKPSEIVFTAGGSESISLAINGVMNHPDNKDAGVVISAIEHDAVRRAAQQYRCDIVGVDAEGMVITEELVTLLSENPDIVLVSIVYASNEIGTIQHITDISSTIATINKNRKKSGHREVLLHIDASQAPLYLDCNVARLGVDLMTLNGGKMYGPKQSGILFIRSGIELTPLIRGGGQEYGLRSGTENVAFAVGFAEALRLAASNRDERVKQVAQMRDYLLSQLEERCNTTLYGSRTKRLANSVLVGFQDVDNEELLIKLDNRGFAVAIGSACHASSGEVSHVLRALGVSDEDAQSTLRISLNEYTTHHDCNKLVDAIVESISS